MKTQHDSKSEAICAGIAHGGSFAIEPVGSDSPDAPWNLLLPDTKHDEAKGEMLANIFGVKRSRLHPGRFETQWGDKTALGIYATARRIIETGE